MLKVKKDYRRFFDSTQLYDWFKIKNHKELNGTQNFTFPQEASLLGQIMIRFLENLSAADFIERNVKVRPPKFTVISTLLNLSA